MLELILTSLYTFSLYSSVIICHNLLFDLDFVLEILSAKSN